MRYALHFASQDATAPAAAETRAIAPPAIVAAPAKSRFRASATKKAM